MTPHPPPPLSHKLSHASRDEVTCNFRGPQTVTHTPSCNYRRAVDPKRPAIRPVTVQETGSHRGGVPLQGWCPTTGGVPLQGWCHTTGVVSHCRGGVPLQVVSNYRGGVSLQGWCSNTCGVPLQRWCPTTGVVSHCRGGVPIHVVSHYRGGVPLQVAVSYTHLTLPTNHRV